MTFFHLKEKQRNKKTNLLCFQPSNKNLRSFNFYFVSVVHFYFTSTIYVCHRTSSAVYLVSLTCWAWSCDGHVMVSCISAFTSCLGTLDRGLLLCLHMEFCSFALQKSPFSAIVNFRILFQLRIQNLLQTFSIN